MPPSREVVGVKQCLKEDKPQPGSVDSPEEQDSAFITRLLKTIEGEIIPRLLLSDKANSLPERRLPSGDVLTSDDIQEFGGLILALDQTRAYTFVEQRRAEGQFLDSIILDLLAPTASYLGELWKTDCCSFTEVTVGLSRLRQLLRDLSPEFESEASNARHGRRALLLATPGEQHTFGLFVVEAFFRREGWDVSGGQIELDG